ncbi:hypothetical protein [Streptomyces sp. NPDC001933]|uniref:hypothetical protein n=1 Tax=Streptomyces sp. NPDC001933 TaxID=3364626 RepID=UPI0036B6580A
MHEDDLDPMTDHDVVTELVFNQTPNGDTGALAPRETFDWPAIEVEHTEHARSAAASASSPRAVSSGSWPPGGRGRTASSVRSRTASNAPDR